MKCACPSCSCDVSASSAVFKNSQSFCSEACANGHPNNEPCHDADGACGCTCGSWPPTTQKSAWAPQLATPVMPRDHPGLCPWTVSTNTQKPPTTTQKSAWSIAELHKDKTILVIIHGTRENESILPTSWILMWRWTGSQRRTIISLPIQNRVKCYWSMLPQSI